MKGKETEIERKRENGTRMSALPSNTKDPISDPLTPVGARRCVSPGQSLPDTPADAQWTPGERK